MKKCVVIILLLLGNASAYSQAGWKSLELPFAISDAFISDSLIAVLGPGFSVATSIDVAESWKIFRTVPMAEALSLTSIWARDTSTVYLYGSNHYEANHQAFHWGAASTVDGGETWGFSFWQPMNTIPAHLHILSRSPYRWYTGIHSKYDIPFGAIDIKDATNGQTIYKGEPNPWDLMCAIDSWDSVCMGVVGRGWPNYRLSRSLDRGRTWDSLSPMPNGYLRQPVLRATSTSRWFMSFDSVLLISNDTGASWEPILKTELPIEDFQIRGSKGYVILSEANYLLASNDSGFSWIAEGIDTARGLTHIQIVNDSEAYAFGPSALIRKGAQTLSVIDPSLPTNGFSIWPNPSHDHLRIEGSLLSYPITYSVLSQLGVKELSGILLSDAEKIKISGLTAAAYTIRLTDSEGRQGSGRFMVVPFQ